MKKYKLRGYLGGIKEDGETFEWSKLKDNLIFDFPDDINPYEKITNDIKQISTNWLILITEITKE